MKRCAGMLWSGTMIDFLEGYLSYPTDFRRENGDAWAELRADFTNMTYEISCS